MNVHNNNNNHENQQPQLTNIKKRHKTRVLLGITGSVAAIKGPELALQLSKELDAHVAVLLTCGGENFWYKAREYNPKIWEQYCKQELASSVGGVGVRDQVNEHFPDCTGEIMQNRMQEYGPLHLQEDVTGHDDDFENDDYELHHQHQQQQAEDQKLQQILPAVYPGLPQSEEHNSIVLFRKFTNHDCFMVAHT